jgi:hypothetical protein
MSQDVIVWELRVAGGNRWFMHASTPQPGAALASRVAGWLATHAGDAAPVATCVAREATTHRVRYVTLAGAHEPSLEDLVFTFWFLTLSGIDRGEATVDQLGRRTTVLAVETERGTIRYELPRGATGNHLRIYAPAGALLGTSNLFDARCLILRPDGTGLLSQVGQLG